jgi:ABC-2 type transport system ATP-binding protein
MDTPEGLSQRLRGTGRLTLEVRGPGAEIQEALRRLPGIAGVTRRGNGVSTFTVEVEKGKDVREDIFRMIAARQWALREMKAETVSLEDIFVHITTREGEESAAGER